MARIVLKISVSLDGFVGAADGDVEWLFPSLSDDASGWIVDTLSGAGAHLMGRVTYQDMAAHWPTSDEPYAAPMNQIPKVVFSRTLKETPWGETRVADGDLTEEISRIKREPGDYALVHGGAGLVQALTRRGLIDEYRLIVHPVALGAGLPLFGGPVNLGLVSSTPFEGGAIGQVYRPV